MLVLGVGLMWNRTLGIFWVFVDEWVFGVGCYILGFLGIFVP